MNKSELRAHVAAETAVPKATADSVVSAVFSAIGDALARGDSVLIAGFGRFTTKERPARQGRNPRTGENIVIAASTAPSFKAAEACDELADTLRKDGLRVLMAGDSVSPREVDVAMAEGALAAREI